MRPGLAGCIVLERPKVTPSRVMLGNIRTDHPVYGIFFLFFLFGRLNPLKLAN